MDNLETTLNNNKNWAIDRIQKMCNTDDPIDYLDAYSVVLEFKEWIDSRDDECDILSFIYSEK